MARVLLLALLLLTIFASVGMGTAWLLVRHAIAHGSPEVQVRLGAAMGGLFAGGAATVLAGVAVLLGWRRSTARPEQVPPQA